MPQTAAYSEIWLDQKMVAGDATKAFSEPLYGQYYLPRKCVLCLAAGKDIDVDSIGSRSPLLFLLTTMSMSMLSMSSSCPS